MQKLLVDENLSPSLVGLATDKGFVCSHVNHLGLTGQKDWQLKTTILDGDWTFITNNGVDFRGSAKKPGSQGVYADVPLHAGLVCVDAPGGLDLPPNSHPFITGDSRLRISSEIFSSPPRLCERGKRCPGRKSAQEQILKGV